MIEVYTASVALIGFEGLQDQLDFAVIPTKELGHGHRGVTMFGNMFTNIGRAKAAGLAQR